ncbi:hypothetical protein, partial [Staphylococcus hominis]|uniref:hypothetical protein n=1 Tax=Staphylococcus hominis TaxID=1290 RepID=UPI001C92C8F6
QHSKLHVLINHPMDHLNQTYHLTLQPPTQTYQSHLSIQTLTKKLKLTNISIQQLPSLNLNPIQQFQQLNEPYT